MNLNDIKKIDRQASAEQWSYPQLFDALKEAGIHSYETDVARYEIVYQAGDNNIPAPAPSDWIPLTVAPDFDAAAVKEAIAQVGRQEISYPEFLAEIATAGVSHYCVDMEARTVSYQGAGQVLVEAVPKIS